MVGITRKLQEALISLWSLSRISTKTMGVEGDGNNYNGNYDSESDNKS